MNNIDKKNLTKKYISNGYCIAPALFKENQIIYLRKVFEDYYSKKGFPRDISVFDIDNKEAIKMILDVINSDYIRSILQEIGNYFNTTISTLPTFDVMRNYYIDRINSAGIGWHRDCNGEMQYDYCKKRVFDKSYVFGKIGIYLQENLEYGGSIDLIPYSHKDIRARNIIFTKLSNIPLKLIQRLQSKFPNVYKIFSENVYMNMIKAKKVCTASGSIVLFDSRIYHRGSPLADSIRNKVLFSSGNYQIQTPSEKTKYVIYCNFGSTLALDSYMHDRLQRKGNSLELQRWANEQKKIENFSPKLALLIQNIMNAVLIKYKDYLHKHT